MATYAQIALSLKRTNDKITKLTKEIADAKQTKIKLTAELQKAKATAPKKAIAKKKK